MKNQVNIGTIGAGVFMDRQHLPNIKTINNVKLRTLCDLDENLLEKRKSEYHPTYVTTSSNDVLHDLEIDIVIVGMRSNLHTRFILEASEAKKNIFEFLAWFLESEPVEIYCAGPLSTDNVTIVKYTDESIVTIICGEKGGLCYPKECMEAFCANRTLVVYLFFEIRYEGPDGNFIKNFTRSPMRSEDLKERNISAFYENHFSTRPKEDITGEHMAN